MSRKTDITFNVLLTAEDSAALELLSEKYHCSKGQIVRQAVRSMHSMACIGVPTCSTGQPCPVPHIHGVPQQAAHVQAAPHPHVAPPADPDTRQLPVPPSAQTP